MGGNHNGPSTPVFQAGLGEPTTPGNPEILGKTPPLKHSFGQSPKTALVQVRPLSEKVFEWSDLNSKIQFWLVHGIFNPLDHPWKS